MTDTSELPYEAVTPYGQAAPTQAVTNTTPADVTDLLQQATQMANEGGPGANADKAQAWLEQQMSARGSINQSTSDGGIIPYEGVEPVKEIPASAVKPVTAPVATGKDYTPSFVKNVGQDFQNLTGEIGSYFKNFGKEHETISPGPLTDKEKAAAKLMGMDNAGNTNAVQTEFSPYYDPALAQSHGQVYKLTPEQRQELNDKTLKAWNLAPAEERARVAATEQGNWGGGNFDLTGHILTNTTVPNLIEGMANPQLTNTKKYYAIQDTVKAMDAIEHPEKYSPQFVQQSKEKIAAYKNQAGQSTWDSVKEMWHAALDNPAKTAKALAVGLADPAFLAVPEARIGTAAKAEDIANSVKAIEEAAKAAKTARAVEAASVDTSPEVAKSAGAAADKAEGVIKDKLTDLKKSNVQERLGNVAGEGIAGSGINTLSTAQQELHDQGYIKKGSLEAPAIAGAVMGGTLGAFGKTGEVVPYESVKPVVSAEELPKPTATLFPQEGKVDPRLLATGAATGLGGTAGAILSPQGQKEKGALAGALGGLLLSTNMWGDAIPTKGFGNKQRGMFAGPRARTNNLFTEALANRLEREGVSAPEIHQQTGLFREAGGKWSHELSDKGVSINEGVLKQTSQEHGGKLDSVPLEQVLNHPELKKAYPDLMKNLKVRQISVENLGGYYDPQEHSITLNDPSYLRHLAKETGDRSILPESILSHEVQHAIDHYESMPRGDSPNPHLQELQHQRMMLEDRWDNLNVMKAEAQVAGDSTKVRKIAQIQGDINNRLTSEFTTKAIREEARRRYLASAGEQKAINVQNRLDMTPEERAASYPPETMSVPYEKQRVEGQPNVLQYHQLPLEDHLKTTGEMDEEGKLHGLTLEEDKLPNEKAVIDRARSGDQQAITTLYKKYMPRLERTLRSVMREAGPRLGLSSEDIASQAFMKAIQALHSFEGVSSFYTWLYRIGRNEALNAIDKGNRTVPVSSMYKGTSGEPGLSPMQGGIEDVGGSPIRSDVEGIASTHDTPEAMATAQQASNMVRYAISKLPQDIKEAIKMKELTGMTEQEIAQAQGVPVGTVKSRLSRGREMLAQSLKRGHGANFRSQGGFATPEQLKKLAKTSVLLGGGATAGLMLGGDQHKVRNAWVGAGLALVGGELNWSKLWPSFKSLRATDARVNVNDLLNNYDYALKNGERYKVQAQAPILKIAKSPEERVAITRAIDSGTVSSLPAHLQKAANHIKQFYKTLGEAAVARGIIPSLVDNYMNRAWVQDAKFKEVMDNINRQMATNMSSKSRHALLRKFVTLEQGKAAGLTPKTEDAVQLMGMYADSINQAMANKTLNEALREYVVDPSEGTKAVMSINKAPAGYVTMTHPQLVGVKVHPSIAPSLDFLYHTYTNNAAVQLAEMMGSAIKRTNVGFSLFHVKNLLDAYFGANPLTRTPQNLTTALKSLAGRSELHKQYMEGGAGDIVDLAMKGGVEFTPPKQHTKVEDVNNNFYDGLDTLQKFMETTLPIKGSGVPVKVVKRLNELNDKLLWENVHAGLKLSTFSNAYGQLNKSWASALAKDPTVKVPSKEELASMAGSYTNDVFGGLNWRRLADEATNQYTRGLALAMASPAGRRLSQVLLFAPDWTYSTVRSWTKAVGKGSGIGGLLHAKTIADLHRQYLLRSALIYMTLYNGANVAMSGHPIWKNKDPLMLDMGNGEKLQANKHLLEVPHAIMHPKAFALNKLGPLPSELADQLLNVDYLNPNYSPPMQGSHLEHAAARFLPFTAQGMQYKTPEARILSVLGMPTYGMTPENKQKYLRDRREQKMEQLMQGRK